MGYDGMIVTDDIEMRAIADNYGVEETVVRGLNAGVDHFLCCRSTAETAYEAIDAVIHAVEKGTLSRETLAIANRRIETFARRYARPVPQRADLSCLRSKAHLSVIERVLKGADPSVTVVGQDPTEVTLDASARQTGVSRTRVGCANPTSSGGGSKSL
jgi:beta-N-acetylhexosaminidase